MGFFKLIYIIPLLLFCNTIFIIQLHSTYLGAIDDLQKQREILEDAKYHIENEPNLEKLAKIQHTQQVFQQWWGDETELKNGSTTLSIGIPAIPRPQRYLTQTLAAIALQLPSSDPNLNTPWRDKIQVYIVNNKPESDFEEFYELKEKYANTNEFVFILNTEPQEDRYADQPDPDDFNNPNDIPGKKVRHQTYDLISLMKLMEGKSKYFLFMEDDFPICPKALDTFYYIIRKLGYYSPNWKAVRTSYGMNGIFVKGNELKSLATFFHDHVAHRPPDGLVVEWMCNSNILTTTSCEVPQRHFTFKWNLYQHVGAVSSLRQTGLNAFPGCWAFYSHLLWTIDGFNANDCDEDDIWPCSVRPHGDVMHRNLDIEGWSYLNGYITVTEQAYGEIDVSLKQRSLKLIYSGPSLSSSLSPPSILLSLLSSFLSIALVLLYGSL